MFTLKAEGKPQKVSATDSAALDGEDDVVSRYTPVFSSEMVWEPQGDQVR